MIDPEFRISRKIKFEGIAAILFFAVSLLQCLIPRGVFSPTGYYQPGMDSTITDSVISFSLAVGGQSFNLISGSADTTSSDSLAHHFIMSNTMEFAELIEPTKLDATMTD